MRDESEILSALSGVVVSMTGFHVLSMVGIIVAGLLGVFVLFQRSTAGGRTVNRAG